MDTRRFLWLTSMVIGVALAVAGCGGDDPADAGKKDSGKAGPSVALAIDVGGLGDQSFNDGAKRGLDRAIKEGLVDKDDTDLLEPNATGSNRDDNLVNLADQGYDLILAISFNFSPIVDEIHGDYPKSDFSVVDGFAKEAPNVSNLNFKEQEGSFLVGAAAALKSKTGTIGFLGGQKGTGLIERFQAGYEAGAKQVNPDIKVLVNYIGDASTAFNDPTKAEALSSKMYDAGADVIYHASGASGAGLFKAAAQAHKLAIGVDSDQSLTASPEQRKYILTSMLKRVDTAVYNAIKQTGEGKFEKGTQVFGLADDGVGYAVNQYNDSPRLLSKDIQAQLEKLRKQVVDGEIEVPSEPDS
jgi:basic membrane protein A